MIRILDAHNVANKVKYVEMAGTSSDTKPTSLGNNVAIATGSVFIEVNTKKVYMFNEASNSWVEQGG